MTATATPTKLRSGDWGARVQGRVATGDSITITTRSGKSWTATVSRVLWSGDGVAICATESRGGGGSRRSGGRRRHWERDCEDCLSVGPCGPDCEYADILRPRR